MEKKLSTQKKFKGWKAEKGWFVNEVWRYCDRTAKHNIKHACKANTERKLKKSMSFFKKKLWAFKNLVQVFTFIRKVKIVDWFDEILVRSSSFFKSETIHLANVLQEFLWFFNFSSKRISEKLTLFNLFNFYFRSKNFSELEISALSCHSTNFASFRRQTAFRRIVISLMDGIFLPSKASCIIKFQKTERCFCFDLNTRTFWVWMQLKLSFVGQSGAVKRKFIADFVLIFL